MGNLLSKVFLTGTPNSTGNNNEATEQQAEISAEHKAMLSCQDRLVAAISNDPIGVSGKLLANGIISEENNAKMLLLITPKEKATILVNNVREAIKVNPKVFFKFLNILSSEIWNKDIVKILHSALRGKSKI